MDDQKDCESFQTRTPSALLNGNAAPTSVASKENCKHDDTTPERSEDSEQKPKAYKYGVMYRVEYKYSDGEIAHEVEGDDEASLLRGLRASARSDSLPPLTITTVFYSNSTKEGSKNQKRSKKKGEMAEKKDDQKDHKQDDQSKALSADKNEVSDDDGKDALFEDFIDSRPSRKSMTIHSRKLFNAIRDVITYYPGISLLGDEFQIYEPYRMLCQYREELRAYKHKQPSWHDEAYRKECNEHLDVLLDFIDSRYGKALEDEEARWARPNPACTFEYLWYMFKPGEVCYESVDDQVNAYITQQVLSYTGMIAKKAIKYELETWNIDFDGYLMGRCPNDVVISPFDGEKEIRSLKYYPARFYNESQQDTSKNSGKTFHEQLVARGRKFWDLAKKGICYQEYSGISADYPHKKLHGRVVIDPAGYFSRYNFEISDRGTKEVRPPIDDDEDDDEEAGVTISAGCQCQSCADNPRKTRRNRFEGFHDLYPGEDKPPEDDTFFLLCNQRVFAFILKSRTWETLYVKDVVDVIEQKHAFQYLVLPEDVKYTLKAISCSYVKAQEKSRKNNTDIVKGKGEGKIFLLHGPPGTGKTLSAELVAELTQRPLLSLTCGDLGTTAEEVEVRLGRYMSLGEAWEAVVLLDEADIYLEARDINEVKRNSLVSVFLRALEYYKGLLFLTTNRVATFDEAFKSRIHVALEYKRLNNDDRRLIWQNNMNMLLSDRLEVTQTAREYVSSDSKILDLEWNGREIRNALQTALSLAEFEAEEKKKDIVKIKSTHLERIVAMSASFQNYIKSAHRNRTDSYLAKQHKLRNDYYQDTPTRSSEKTANERSKYWVPQDDERTPKAKAKAARMDDGDEDEDSRLQPRKHTPRKSTRVIPEDEEDLHRSATKQSRRKIQQPATIEEESEEEALRPKKGGRRALRTEEEESEEVRKPNARKLVKNSARRVTPDEEEEEEEEEAPKLTRLSRKLTQSAMVDEEESEDVMVLSRTRESSKRAAGGSQNEKESVTRHGRSPVPLKKGTAKVIKRMVSESEDEE